MMMRLQKYDFTAHYERGENMHLADLLSRAYLPYKGKEVDDFESVNMSHIRPTFRRNKGGDPEGPVSARVVGDYSCRMA